VVAFSTVNRVHHKGTVPEPAAFLRDDSKTLRQAFRAAVEATEEAVLNALFRATTMVGRDDHVRYQLPVQKVEDILRKFNVL